MKDDSISKQDLGERLGVHFRGSLMVSDEKPAGEDGVLDAESTLQSSREADLDPSQFEPPKKYKRKDLMKGMKK